MKISYRILLINFVIVVLVFVSSTLAFYSLTRKLLSMQHSRTLQYSAHDLIPAFSGIISEADYDFLKTSGRRSQAPKVSSPSVIDENMNVDFILRTGQDRRIIRAASFLKPTIQIDSVFTINEFIKNYPDAVIKEYKAPEGGSYFYGVVITEELLNKLSKKIRAEIALLLNDVPVSMSNEKANTNYSLNILNAARLVDNTKTPGIVSEEHSTADFYATFYEPREIGLINRDVKFLVFSPLPEAAELRGNITFILVLIGLAGVGLSLVLTLLFTSKLRRQITNLNSAAVNTRSGSLKGRVDIVSSDEIGSLGAAFNSMLDELEQNEITKTEYTEFLSLIHRNPALNELSVAALTKIIQDTGLSFGLLSIVEEGELRLVSSYGVQNKQQIKLDTDLYQRVISNAEMTELIFEKDHPELNSGLLTVKIGYLLICPIVYNKNVIAVLELAGLKKPEKDVRGYLLTIHDQLAIGLTNSLAFMSLEIQKEKAVEATILKSQFLASMSHELRTPLVSILGLSDLIIKDRFTTGESRQRLEIIRRNGNRLLRLINDILDFSKVEAGKMSLHMEEFRLSELLQDIENHVIPIVSEKNSQGSTSIAYVLENKISSELQIRSDREKITRILLNLLGNAVKFTEKGTISLSAEFTEQNVLEFHVVDSGIGIDSKDMDIIFEEFRQIDGTSARKYNGTGLGLAISKRLAAALNGSLDCSSRPGMGSVFILRVPVETCMISSDEEPVPEFLTTTETSGKSDAAPLVATGIEEEKLQDESRGGEKTGGSSSVLIIEEDEEICRIFSEYLTAKNYTPEICNAGNEVFRRIKETMPAGVVMNMSLGQNFSWDLLKQMKLDAQTRTIPVIPTTVMSELNIGYALNVFDYLIKPLERSLIVKLLERLGRKEPVGNIIVVDSEDAELSDMLAGMGLNVSRYTDSITALKHVFRSKPDLIIVDFFMPRIDGITFAHKLKKSMDTKEIPIVLTLKADVSEKDYLYYQNSLEKAALKAKGHPMDMLRILRDRLNFEEGRFSEDLSNVWLEIREEKKEAIDAHEKIARAKVLIVDDDPDTLFTVGEIVRSTGCQTVFARNGLECLTTLKNIRPDLVLLDIMMPQMDGFETIRRIRADKKLADIPVIALTAITMSEENQVVIRNGFNDYISKPVDPGILSFKLEKVLVAE